MQCRGVCGLLVRWCEVSFLLVRVDLSSSYVRVILSVCVYCILYSGIIFVLFTVFIFILSF